MILCSKRVFLNVLTQLWTRELLLNANYYILDPTFVSPSRKLVANGDKFETFNDSVTQTAFAGASGYHIHYIEGNLLNPSVYETTLLQSDGNATEADVYRMVINELNKDSTRWGIHSSLFEKEPGGNKIQICIYNRDSTIADYGNLICQYLAYNFGCDIVFLDYMCKDNIQGQLFYQGNKENAVRTISYLRDYNLIEDFKQNLTTSSFTSRSSNIQVWLRHVEWDQLLHLYGLLFPNDPLPPGEYTDEMLKKIIVGKCTEGMPTFERQTAVGNLIYSTTDLFGDILDQYDSSDEDEFDKYGDMDLESMFS